MTVRRGLFAVAAVLAALSLGLPWSSTDGVPGRLLPGSTIVGVNSDGSMSLELGPSLYMPGLSGRTVVGAEHTMRVTAAAAALLLVLAVRRRAPALGWWGLAIATLAVPIGLHGATGIGRITYALGIAVAALALRGFRFEPSTPRAAT